jgi:hypothetical protein
VNFEGAEIGGKTSFHLTTIDGTLNFTKTKFGSPAAQEEACRRAKRIAEELGDREDADHYFYREMEAKRLQSPITIRYLEVPMQYVFGYGTKWKHVLVAWFVIVLGFGTVFWIGDGVYEADTLLQNLYFSVVTATTLGYGDYHPRVGLFQIVASMLAIFGTFMWAAFVVLFARKYMR